MRTGKNVVLPGTFEENYCEMQFINFYFYYYYYYKNIKEVRYATVTCVSSVWDLNLTWFIHGCWSHNQTSFVIDNILYHAGAW